MQPLRLLILLLITLSSFVAVAQNSPKAQKAYEKGEKLYKKEKYNEVPECYAEAIAAETDLGEGADHAFLGKVLFQYARFFISDNYYGYASQFFFWSALNYQRAGDSIKAESALSQASYFSDSCDKYQSMYYQSKDSMGRKYIRYPVRSIDSVSGDTTWFSVNLGTRDSLTPGQKGSILTIYDKNDPKRELEYYGKTVLVDLDFGRSKWYSIVDPEFKPKNIGLQAGDLLYVEVGYDMGGNKGIFDELVALGVIFKDYNGDLMYNYRLTQSMNQKRSEQLLIRMMRNTVRHTARELYDPNSDDYTQPLDSGAFKGLNMWEAMLQSTDADIRAFLQFVIDYPGKYMGRNFRIDETYATWIINNTPVGDDYARMMLDNYLEISDQAELNEWTEKYARYLEVAEFDFQRINDVINELVIEEKYKEADSINDDWINITKVGGYEAMNTDFIINKGYIYNASKDYEKSQEILRSVLEKEPDNLNAHYTLAHTLLAMEDFTGALKHYKVIMEGAEHYPGGYGSYGWTLLKMAKNQQAMEYLKKAYDMDSTEPTYIMNYAHGLMLVNKPKEARQLYESLLDHINYESTFTEGLIADFDFFIENGRREEEFKIEKSHMLSQWEKHYKFKIKSNELFKKGEKYRDWEEYGTAATLFDQAVDQEKKGLNVRYGVLRNYYRWAGYNYYKNSEHEKALERYTSGWNVNRGHLNDIELEIQDLEAISNEYDWLDNDILQDMYRKMQFAAQRKYQNQQRSNNLFILSIGSNGPENVGYKSAESDARKIAEVIDQQAKLIFDNSHIITLNQQNGNKDTITKSIEYAISHSKPGDCFILYYSGYSKTHGLVVGKDTILNDELLGWLSSMPATKKLILIDAANKDLIPTFIQNKDRHYGEFSAESVSFLISDGRVEMPQSESSLFTSYLINGFSGDASTNWKNDFIQQKDSLESSIAYVTSKSLEGYLYGNMSSGNLRFDLNSYSSGVDFPLTFVSSASYSVDTIPPMIYIPNVISSDGKRGGKTKMVTITKNVGGQALDESGIREITVNGHAVDFTQNGKFRLDENFTDVWTKLVITATDQKGNATTDSFYINKAGQRELVDPGIESQKQKNYALLFSTSKYDADEWSYLENPKKDVETIGYLLETNYGFEVQIVEDTTVEGMRTILLDYMKKHYGPKDQLFVFFAGHGHYDPHLGGHIVCKNSKGDDQTLQTYLRYNYITEGLNNIYSCKHIFLAFDVCFGGAAFNKTDAISYSGSSLQDILKNKDGFIDQKMSTKSRLFITSGSLEYVPDESQFAKKFIETLRSRGVTKGGLLTFDDFTDNMQTISSLPDSERPTTPRYGSFGDHQAGADFIFIYRDATTPKTHQMKKEITR